MSNLTKYSDFVLGYTFPNFPKFEQNINYDTQLEETFEFLTNRNYGGYHIPDIIENILEQKIKEIGVDAFLEKNNIIFNNMYSYDDGELNDCERRIIDTICESRTHPLLIELVKKYPDECKDIKINRIPNVLKYCVQLHEYDGKESLYYKIDFGYTKFIKKMLLYPNDINIQTKYINKITNLTNIFNYYKSKLDSVYRQKFEHDYDV